MSASRPLEPALLEAKITASAPELLRLLSKQLYQDPEIFVRELLANSFDAVQRRRAASPEWKEGGAVNVLSDSCRIVFDDDGIGMSREDLVDILSCIGRSGSAVARRAGVSTIGRFGLGFLSALAVAARIDIESRSAIFEEDGAWRWSWQGGDKYILAPCAKESAGTRIELLLLPEFRIFADENELGRVICRHVPLLPLTVTLGSRGDPRGEEPPWLALAPGESRVLTPRSVEALLGQRPLHCFAAVLSDGCRLALALPSEQVRQPTGVRLCQHGVLVSSAAQRFLPEGWRWLHGLVDLTHGILTLDREGLHDAQLEQRLRPELTAVLVRQLLALYQDQPELWQRALALHRQSILALFLQEPELCAALGGTFPLTTTCGELSIEQILARAESTGGLRKVYIIEHEPYTEPRWACARAQRHLIVWCREATELMLLGRLKSPGLELHRLHWFAELQQRDRPPPIPEELRPLFGWLRGYFEQHQIQVEPAIFSAGGLLAVAELPVGIGPPAPDSASQPLHLRDVLGPFFSSLHAHLEPMPLYGRLYVNMASELRRLDVRPEAGQPLEPLAALLFTAGVLNSGLAVPPQWLPLLEQIIQAGLNATVGAGTGTLTAASRGPGSAHVICFFAHEYRSHKPLLPLIRSVVEHAPFFWEVTSADEQTRHEQLFGNVVEHLKRCDVVFTEVSTQNPNVLLELGIAYGMGDKRIVLLGERGVQLDFADLRGNLLFHYDALESQPDRFVRALRSWLAGEERLRTLRRTGPFLGYRLLVEQGVIPEEAAILLGRLYLEPTEFLAESPHQLQLHTGLPQATLLRCQQYLSERVAAFAKPAL